jgi:hypothetical protein
MAARFVGAQERPTSITVQNRFPVLHLTRPAAETGFVHYSSPSPAFAFVEEASGPALHFCYGVEDRDREIRRQTGAKVEKSLIRVMRHVFVSVLL